MAQHNDLGKWGEEVAAKYLEQQGWYIRHRDWRYKHTDIDIVCIDEEDTTLLFVEVKTRASDVYGRPSEAVDADKRRNIMNAASAYRRMFRKENRMVRYDIIAIVGSPDGPMPPVIEHIVDAFNFLDVFLEQG